MTNSLTLKWGSLKAWDLETEEAQAAMRRYLDYGKCVSAILHHDTDEQKQALLELIDHADEIYLDWDDKHVTREEAKEYVRTYGQDDPEDS